MSLKNIYSKVNLSKLQYQIEQKKKFSRREIIEDFTGKTVNPDLHACNGGIPPVVPAAHIVMSTEQPPKFLSPLYKTANLLYNKLNPNKNIFDEMGIECVSNKK